MAATHQISSSSSCSSSTISAISAGSKVNYEVFLSFYGKDVRYNFADHLYTALTEGGIHAFRDSEKLCKGNNIEEDLLTAIQQSKISIPILSENYALSKWCLKELAHICDCRKTLKQIVMPIFYKVEPREVRGQKRKYKEAFEQHLINMAPDVQKWKDAMKEVGELDGWHVKDETPEGQMIKQVVKEVYDKLGRRPFCENNSLVGAESRIDKIFMLLDIKSNNRKIIGIHGLGGIGKTTIAKVVYNEVFNHFEGCSFIANVREAARQNNGLAALQNQLLRDTLKYEGQDIPSVVVGIDVIQQRLYSKKVLIVLDDVDREDQVRAFVGNREWFGLGSKIIITSRDKSVLNFLEPDGIYELPPMDLNDSLQLFSHHAFKINHPPDDFSDLSKAMVETTRGLPLALQVVGSSLYLQKDRLMWQEMLEKLQKVPPGDVIESLKISYNGLSHEEKQMFLDIACFFIGMYKNIVCYIWKGCGFYPLQGLSSLCQKSLVTVGESNVLGMHDLLRDLGRSIVCQENANEPGRRARIWHQEDVLKVLYTQTGTSSVLGLNIDFRSMPKNESLSSEGFVGMKCLQLLRIDGAKFSWNFPHSFSELRWLSWQGCPNQFNQTSFYPIKLVVLNLSRSDITEDWMGWNYIKMAKNLKALDLSWCCGLSRTPDLSENHLLEVLRLSNCSMLEEIDTSICLLTNLLILDISYCQALRVPPRQISNLINLQELNLHGTALKKLPENLGRMVSLMGLHLCLRLWRQESAMDLSVEFSQMTSLKSLALKWSSTSLTGISCLPPSLTSLVVGGCNSIQDISGLPSSLTSLSVNGCDSLVKLSGTSRGLGNLKKLYVENCKSLEEIEGFDDVLDSLEDFQITRCRSLQKLPSLRGSKYLRTSKVICNDRISVFEGDGMDSLEGLEIHMCSSLRKIPYLQDSKRLTILQIKCCREILEIGCLGNCESLQHLTIEDLGKLTEISGLDGLRSLRTMTIRYCKNLLEIHGINGSENLEELTINCCESLGRIPDFSNFNKLKHLSIEGNKNFDEIKELNISCCKLLEDLEIRRFRHLERLPALSIFKKLSNLCIEACNKLNEILCVEELESLSGLLISGCKSLRRLLDLSNLKRLEWLHIKGCKILTEIHGVDTLEFLRSLHISGCESLESLPDLSNLKWLREVNIEGCNILPEIPGIDRLENLENLHIIGCESLESLPDLSNLQKLSRLGIGGCKNLTKIKGVEILESLCFLKIIGCDSLEILPNLPNLKKLAELRIEGSKNLTKIQGVDTLESLKIIGCESLEILPNLSNLKWLEFLYIKDCRNLTEIQGVDTLESLRKLHITGCESLEVLPDLSNLRKLESLKIIDCRNLTEIQGVDTLDSLLKLHITGGESLEIISIDLSNLKNLKILVAKDCKKLTAIQAGNNPLEYLESLDVRGCISLEKVPDCVKSKELRNLNGVFCMHLTDIDRIRLLIDDGCSEFQLALS